MFAGDFCENGPVIDDDIHAERLTLRCAAGSARTLRRASANSSWLHAASASQAEMLIFWRAAARTIFL
jgi:hypothetical protein